MSRASDWCFTLNNYNDDEVNIIRNLPVQYVCYGKEVGESGTPHLQGFLQLGHNHRKTLTALKAFIGIPRIHLEIRSKNATNEQARDYCFKSDKDPFQKGDFCSGQGMRSDIDRFVAKIREGASVADLLDTCPEEMVKYHKAYDRFHPDFAPKRNWPMEVIWCYGPTGTGKSFWANRSYPDAFRKPPGKWWDGYDGEETVILDEFRADWFPFYHLLLLLDRYPLKVEIKGGTRQFSSKRVIITCPVHWNEMYRSQTEEKLNQLQRRITETRFFPYRHGDVGVLRENLVVHQYHHDFPAAEEAEQLQAPDNEDAINDEAFVFNDADYDFLFEN